MTASAASVRRRSMILLHGWTMTGQAFDGLQDHLGERYPLIAPDLPGHGASLSQPPTLRQGAEMIAAEIARLDGPPPVLVGWSMGAAMAWSYIARCGCDALGGLVTVDMSPRMRNAPNWQHGLLGQSAADVTATTQRMRDDWQGVTHSIAATMFATPAGASGFDREAARAAILRQDAEVMRAAWDALLALDARPTIPRIDCPYLVCRGAHSRVYPASASQWICDHAPDARMQVFEHSGHSPHLEEPAEFARVLTRFAQSLD